MITFEEAEDEHQRELDRENKLDALENVSEGDPNEVQNVEHGLTSTKRATLLNPRMSAKVIATLPSFRISKHKQVAKKDPSFFLRVFSSRKLNRVAGSDEDIFSEISEEDAEHHGHAGGKKKKKSEEDEEGGVEDDEEEEEKDEQATDELLPPMPKIGKPVNIDLLSNRSKNALRSMDILMGMVDEDVGAAVSSVHHIPVGDDFDRAAVTADISKYIAQVKSSAGIQGRLRDNVISSQKALNYRRSGLIMMNSNYNHQLVRKLEPIYVNEARTITKHKE
ncbi:hypothetical protein EON65_37395 [archaeon]|nr:MAG: hypothetical protein EON65_37395 [archaeon]